MSRSAFFLWGEPAGTIIASDQISPIHSSIQNVKGDPEELASNAPPAFFVIVLKNGSRLKASAVWVQGNEARFVDAEGQGGGVPLADVNRAATRDVNQASHLNLRLPPPAR